ncbi:class I adenylate-forming enzyme family protein [Pseudoflavonifractor phocaeensis]|uniref:class I adenylate-forming enzyme family protein n=1 Tax=Pseudoflavonifractor phocaeensis TaxID=1870988 RepID=UPI00195ACE00|nr:class I adenylate-forming enzyme family protein [Pseudoflavonifractor phocaeensis]MBM6927096.1 acyl--CoA ligase [Pseudoflavonifractor phocaeensis]
MIGTLQQRQAELSARFPVWRPMTLYQMLEAQAQRLAGQPFLVTPEGAWTYGRVLAESRRLAAALAGLGIGQGSRAAVCLGNGPAFVLLTFALARLGAVKVPLNTGLGPVERAYQLEHIRPSLLVEGDETCPTVRWGAALKAQTTWAALLERGGDGPAQPADCPDRVCDIIFTSGSNGLPKGVQLTHDMLLRSAYASCLNRGFEPGRRIYIPLPLFHVYGYVEGLLAALLAGGSVLMQPGRFSPGGAITLMAEFRANDLLAVPSLMMDLLRCPALEEADLSALHAAYCSASACPDWLWPAIRQRLGVDDVVTGYGMTEVAGAVVQTAPSDTDALLSNRVGRCLRGGCAGVPGWDGRIIDYRVVCPETGQALPPGQAGELWCRGPVVTRGYFDAPEANAQAFTAGGWFRTGDVGRFDADGCLELLGRLSDMYKMNGENVSPEFVARVIGACDAVAHAEVVGVPDPKTGEAGAAFLELRPGLDQETALEAVKAHCGTHLARYQLPKYYQLMGPEDWPLTGSGKVSKGRLRQILQGNTRCGEKAGRRG